MIVGPTAVGKTELSLSIGEKFSGEIVSVDSMQVYRYMDIGTAKASPAERARLPHHLIDIVDPDDEYTAGRFVEDASNAMADIAGRGKLPLLVGGTGLYLQSLLSGLCEFTETDGLGNGDESLAAIRDRLKESLAQEGGREKLFSELEQYDPESAARIHPNDSQRILRGLEIFHATRIPWSEHLARQRRNSGLGPRILKLGLFLDREMLYERIGQRTEMMWEEGLVSEVERLLDMGYDSSLKSMQSIGYRHAVNFLAGEWDRAQTLELLARDTRRYAKRQFTWFKKDNDIIWVRPDENRKIFQMIEKYMGT